MRVRSPSKAWRRLRSIPSRVRPSSSRRVRITPRASAARELRRRIFCALPTERHIGPPPVKLYRAEGRVAVQSGGASGRGSRRIFQRVGWTTSDVSVQAGGLTHLLWTAADGRMSISAVNASGLVNRGPDYGPTPGWSAVAIADASG